MAEHHMLKYLPPFSLIYYAGTECIVAFTVKAWCVKKIPN